MRKIGEPISPYEERESRGITKTAEPNVYYHDKHYENPAKEIERLEKRMKDAAKNLEFEKAAELRDTIAQIRSKYSL